jgi:hypothetical protein
LVNEFRKRLELKLGKETLEKVLKVIEDAGEEFPCLACPSKDDCANFKWYLKWFIGVDN